MIEAATILLTSPDPGLVSGLTGLRPRLNIIDIGAPGQARIEMVDGPVWGFVDWLLPDQSGLELCRQLRDVAATRGAHLTMVLESGDADARRRALAAGADDYIVGPLTAERVLARVEGITPEAPALGGQRMRLGELVIDPAAFQARYRGEVLPLRPTEFRLLLHFMAHPDQVFSRAGLIRHLGKEAGTVDERTVDVWIGRLRRGLKAHGVPDPLRTVRSLGYVLDSPAA